jgi:predicted DNA-binding protein
LSYTNTAYQGIIMPLSIRLDPMLEARVEEESRRRGVTKSEVVKDALERVLGLKNPRELLDQVRSGTPMRRPAASTATGAGMKAKLRAKRPA